MLDARSPEPDARPGDAVVRVLRAGIAPIDLATARGIVAHNGVMGHEFVGIVERVQGEPGSPLIGKRVVGQPDVVCAACDLCRAGLSRHCRMRRMIGVGGVSGCIAERFAAPARNLVLVPDSIDTDSAAMAEPLACAIHAAQIVRIVGKTYVTVLGDDSHALLIAQVMARQNASVRVLGERPERFSVAEKWGVKHRHLSEVGRHADQDVVVCSSPDARILDLAMGLVRPRGKIVVRGASVQESGNAAWHGVDLSPVVAGELEIVGARGGRVADAVSALEQKQYDVVSLISRRFRIAEAVTALRAAAEPDALKVLIEF